ncbi:small, acid-soluble spore protein, alpha/beta type [Alicyclobacillus herbarius]|uniref:small, acid-soluble spore protein, alpha/beta type n=1 Tax=Alicyclobacillus herbarius TaxID=122960 RepID=UPI0004797E92|nr:small, acid-soluble spore protein, alpha/beta type [Alicyclobacillus herbarius]
MGRERKAVKRNSPRVRARGQVKPQAPAVTHPDELLPKNNAPPSRSTSERTKPARSGQARQSGKTRQSGEARRSGSLRQANTTRRRNATDEALKAERARLMERMRAEVAQELGLDASTMADLGRATTAQCGKLGALLRQRANALLENPSKKRKE